MNDKHPAPALRSRAEDPTIRKLLRSLGERPAELAGLCGNSDHFIVSLLGEASGSRVIYVHEKRAECERAATAISSIKGTRIPVFLSRGMEKNRSLFEKKEITEPERLHSLIRWKETGVLCTDAAAMAEVLAPPREFWAESFAVETGAEIERDEVLERLSGIGYREADFTERRGQMSVRGAIVDLFSPGSERPARLEFFGDRVNSIREFSPSTQKSTGKKSSARINPASFAAYGGKNAETAARKALLSADARGLTSSEVEPLLEALGNREHFRGIEWFTPLFWESRQCVLDYPEEDPLVCLSGEFEEDALLRRLEEKFEDRKGSLGKLAKALPPFQKLYLEEEELRARLGRSRLVFLRAAGTHAEKRSRARFRTEEISFPEPSIKAFLDEAEKLVADGYDVFVFFTSPAEKEKFLKLSEDYPKEGITYLVGELFESTVLHDFKVALFTEKTLFGKTRPRVAAWKANDVPSAFLTSFSSLKPGDHIVHRECGVGIFRGLRRLSFASRQGDFIECEYRDGDKVFVPVEKSSLVQKYAGDGNAPKIEKLGSANWRKTVGRVRRAVEEVAADLVELYAERKLEKGFRFSPRDQMFNEFELAFPWSETPDQSAAIEDVMGDMESERAMDRLICGDVGFGKTEVALRAALKASLDGKQIMMLAPTTLLASQHYRTALGRLENWPVRVETLSRFTRGKKEREILEGLSDGAVDMVVGTHKLLGKRIRFRNLGLVIIDEEQKFGVTHKKAIRAMKKGVDVLTLSATPIPRTLQLSLADVSDVSIINTPPEGRQPVEVYVQEFSVASVKEAAEKEMLRNGTVFFIHNRIEDIFEKAAFLGELLPKASIGVTHGRMNEKELSKTMEEFAEGKVDVLVTTAIVESGLDIPRANTIIVNDAHAMGLADLYQLKGRVGRSDRKAYAHFLIPSPGSVTEEAKNRLEVLSRLTDLGSGFRLALSDLQIRGAGTLFGKEQSGHIADVGLEFYLELLKDTIESKRKGKARPGKFSPEIRTRDDAFIPESYMESGSQRLFYYKKISSAETRGEPEKIMEEIEDRFGAAPEALRRLVLIAELKLALREKSVRKAEIGSRTATLSFAGSAGGKLSIALSGEDRYESLIAAVERLEEPAPPCIV